MMTPQKHKGNSTGTRKTYQRAALYLGQEQHEALAGMAEEMSEMLPELAGNRLQSAAGRMLISRGWQLQQVGQETLQRVDDYAEQRGISRAEALRELLEAALAADEKTTAAE